MGRKPCSAGRFWDNSRRCSAGSSDPQEALPKGCSCCQAQVVLFIRLAVPKKALLGKCLDDSAGRPSGVAPAPWAVLCQVQCGLLKRKRCSLSSSAAVSCGSAWLVLACCVCGVPVLRGPVAKQLLRRNGARTFLKGPYRPPKRPVLSITINFVLCFQTKLARA